MHNLGPYAEMQGTHSKQNVHRDLCAEVEHTPSRKCKLYQHKLEFPLQWTIVRAMSAHPQQPYSMVILSNHPQQPLKIGRYLEYGPNVFSRHLQ